MDRICFQLAKASYNKFVAKINAIISDGVVMEEEAEDLTWLCKNCLDVNFTA